MLKRFLLRKPQGVTEPAIIEEEPAIVEEESATTAEDPELKVIDPTWSFMHRVPDQTTPKLPPGKLPFRSESCSEHHFYFDLYRYWVARIQETPRFHRKQWEFVYIAQVLWERGLLAEGNQGLGFGVGNEPLASLFAQEGCTILATDLETEVAQALGWVDTHQHAASLHALNERGICDKQKFLERVSFQSMDMNYIPPDLTHFDFCWSACALEHLGGIEAGLNFVINSLKPLSVGGWAVHTTELNCSSNEETLDTGSTVLYCRRDIEALFSQLQALGHFVEPLLIHNGQGIADGFIDVAPYRDEPHLRLMIESYATTSIGLIIQKRVAC